MGVRRGDMKLMGVGASRKCKGGCGFQRRNGVQFSPMNNYALFTTKEPNLEIRDVFTSWERKKKWKKHYNFQKNHKIKLEMYLQLRVMQNTKEAPAIVKSYYDQRIVGCPGVEGEDEHDVVGFC
uniref:Uncharacterized protein n=1 Tax=Lactuca sativa TaxID=4236 RepID=A0A9R1W843_LACSA|nr:hypothetical protein LSAT_V11C300127480 [Lactuca sativa]